MSRSARVLGALSVGYVSQALTLVVGLWLTPFLLHRLGQHDYGLWLIALQTTAYLSLLDLGVVALLPRETAYAVGRAAAGADAGEIQALVGRTARIVMRQLPVVAVVGAAVLLGLPEAWGPLRGPLAITVCGFVVMFPLRMLQAVLDGLQEVVYLGWVTLGTWVLGTAMTVVLVLAGLGLYAVAFGWLAGQLAAAASWWYRVHTRHPHVIPRRLPPFPRGAAGAWLRSGLWVSVQQVAQVLLVGTDVFVIGRLLGPAALVPYAVTSKLASVLANQPQMIMQVAVPGLSELRTAGTPEGLARACGALGQAMLFVSGAVVCVVLAINQGFVGWWVGSTQYGGLTLSALVLLAMIVRHWNSTLTYTLFALGFERRIAVTALLNGVVGAVAMALLTRWLGLIGAPLGLLIGVCAVSVPGNLAALARAQGGGVAAIVRPLWAWLWRFAALTAAAALVARHVDLTALPAVVLAATASGAVYVAVMFPVALQDPLGAYVRPRVAMARRLWLTPARLRDA